MRRLISGFNVVNLRWQDLSEVNLRVGVFGADLVIRADQATDLAIQAQHGARVITIEGLRKDQAQAVYRICQAQDQAWREKRRIRELEELRARSGGVQLSAAAGAGAARPAPSEAVRRLQEAKQMLDSTTDHRLRIRIHQGTDPGRGLMVYLRTRCGRRGVIMKMRKIAVEEAFSIPEVAEAAEAGRRGPRETARICRWCAASTTPRAATGA